MFRIEHIHEARIHCVIQSECLWGKEKSLGILIALEQNSLLIIHFLFSFISIDKRTTDCVGGFKDVLTDLKIEISSKFSIFHHFASSKWEEKWTLKEYGNNINKCKISYNTQRKRKRYENFFSLQISCFFYLIILLVSFCFNNRQRLATTKCDKYLWDVTYTFFVVFV